MERDRPLNVQERANKVVENYINDKLACEFDKIRSLDGANLPHEDVQEILRKTNAWLKWVDRTGELYDDYRFRAFAKPDGSVQVTQGRELDCEP